MSRKSFYALYRTLTECAATGFAWWAFGWKAALLLFLILWALNVARAWSKFDRP